MMAFREGQRTMNHICLGVGLSIVGIVFLTSSTPETRSLAMPLYLGIVALGIVISMFSIKKLIVTSRKQRMVPIHGDHLWGINTSLPR